MYVNRDIPAKCLVDAVIFRRRGKILVTSYYMRDSHKVVIYNVCKVIGWVSIGFDQDQILKLFVVYCNVSVNNIMEGSSSLCRHVKTNYVRLTSIQAALNLLPGKLQTAFVIDGYLLACNNTLHAL